MNYRKLSEDDLYESYFLLEQLVEACKEEVDVQVVLEECQDFLKAVARRQRKENHG